MICFSGYLMSSASIQKLFCGIYSTFKCFFLMIQNSGLITFRTDWSDLLAVQETLKNLLGGGPKMAEE